MNLHEPLALAALLGIAYGGYACTTISHQAPPPDWPKLSLVAKEVSHKEMRDMCNQWAHWAMSPSGCAVIDFAARTCTQWRSKDFPLSASEREHEDEHCRGKDHIGSTTLRDAWHRVKTK
jgi:hypothetical protein